MSYLLEECIKALRPYYLVKNMNECLRQDYSNSFIGERVWFTFKGKEYYIHEMYTSDNKHLFVIRNCINMAELSNENINECIYNFIKENINK